jgi:hypothetical protein
MDYRAVQERNHIMTKKKKQRPVQEEATLSFFPCVLCGSHMVPVEGTTCTTCRDTLSTATVVEVPLVEGDSLINPFPSSMEEFSKWVDLSQLDRVKSLLFGGRKDKDSSAVPTPDKGTVPTATLTAKSVRGTAWALLKKGTDKIHAFLKKHVAQISVGVTSMLIGLPLATSFLSWAAIAAAIGGGIMLVFHLIRAKGDIKRLAWSDYMDDVTGTVVTSLVSMLLMTASIFWPLFLMQDLVEMGYLFNSTKA